jgi:tetratricopeptide (TPR) repeat protein
LVPRNLSAYYDIKLIPHQFFDNIVDLILTIGLSVFIWIRRKDKMTLLGIAFFFISIFLMLKVIRPFGEYSIYNNRYTYLPLIGILIPIVRLNSKKIRVGLIIVGIIMSVMTIVDIPTWYDGSTLWKEVLRKYPGTAVAHNNLGRWYLDEGDYANAKINLYRTIEDEPNYALAYYNLGLISQNDGDYKMALEYYNVALNLRSNFFELLNNLGFIYHNIYHENDKAIDYYRRSIEAGANMPEVYFNLALSLAEGRKLENLKIATSLLNDLLVHWPDFYQARKLLSEIEKTKPIVRN